MRDEELDILFDDGESITILMQATSLRGSSGEVVGAVATGVDITAPKKREASLRRLNAMLSDRVEEGQRKVLQASARLDESEQRFRLLVQGVTDYAIFMLDPNGLVSSWNAGAERIKGYAAEEIIGQHFSRFYPEEDRRAGAPARALDLAARQGRFEGEGWRVRKSGASFWASVVIDPIRDHAGRIVGFAKVTRDLTEKRTAEEQLRQAQKMEALGQLTGGIAHDFNNLLQVVIANLDLLRRRTDEMKDWPAAADLRRYADAASHGADRAATLTRKLLAFSRRQPLDPKAMDVDRLISGMSDLLHRTLRESIAIEIVLGDGLWHVLIDSNELENAIVNLAVNARDAMTGGGKLTIETAEAYIDEAYAAMQHEVGVGQYVLIAVSDTGAGMSKDVAAHAFDPFFTTKEQGHGTGLGLSQVYGFVRQSGGHVKIYSDVGVGTTVKIYLPRLLAEAPNVEAPSVTAAPRSMAGELVLLVEDDDYVRHTTSDSLRDLGYRVVSAADGLAGLRLLHDHPDIRLLFADVGLPGGMNGWQLAEAVQAKRPGLPVLFTSAYARNLIGPDGRLDPDIELLKKPFTYASLAAEMRKLLDGG